MDIDNKIRKNLEEIRNQVVSNNMTLKTKLALALIICVLGGGVIYYFSKPVEDSFLTGETGPIPVEAIEVKLGDMARKIKSAGTLTAHNSVTLRPEVSGQIKEILFTEGQEVKKGDPLYKIEDGQYRAQVKEAEAKLALSRVEYDRAVALLKKDFGTTQARDKALSVMRINEAELQVAKIRLDNTIVKAPFEGTVGISNVSPGAFVSESVELVQLVDLTPIYVDFHVAESYLGTFKVGDTVDVTIEGFDILPYEASIKAISPQIELGTRTVQVRAEMENPDLALRPGQYARVVVEAGQAKDVPIIPESAIEREGDEEFVMKVVDGIAIRTVIDPGFRDGSNVEVVNGLKAGDMVVVAGQFKLQDGQEVTIVDKDK